MEDVGNNEPSKNGDAGHYFGVYQPIGIGDAKAKNARMLGGYPDLKELCEQSGVELVLAAESLAKVEELLGRSESVSTSTLPTQAAIFLGDTLCSVAPQWQWQINPDGYAILALGEITTWDVVDYVHRNLTNEAVLVSAFEEMQRRAQVETEKP